MLTIYRENLHESNDKGYWNYILNLKCAFDNSCGFLENLAIDFDTAGDFLVSFLVDYMDDDFSKYLTALWEEMEKYYIPLTNTIDLYNGDYYVKAQEIKQESTDRRLAILNTNIAEYIK